MFSWVEMIGELYHLNVQRLELWRQGEALAHQSPAFIPWLMSEERQQLLAKPVPIGTGLAQQEKQSLIPKLPP
jgi:hypothetical protein